MNETLHTIARRYTCRDYKNEMPSDAVLSAVAAAAVQSPSAMNRQGWRVTVVKNQALIREMEDACLAGLAAMEDQSAYNRIMERGGKPFYGAPAMILVPIDPAEYASAVMDCGIVCQTIALAAESLGMASTICGLAGLAFAGEANAEKFGAALGFPKGYAFGCSVLLGFANTKKPPHEPDLDKIVVIE